MITSKDNPAIKRIRALQSRSRQRRHEQAFIVEGVRLTRELLSSLLVPEQIFFTESAAAHTPQLLEMSEMNMDGTLQQLGKLILQFLYQ